MSALGDFKLGSTVYDYFTTTVSTGAPTVLAGTPVVSVYEDDSNTQITSGVTLGVDADGVVGLNRLTIVATSGNGYEVGKQYTAVITTGTVGGTSAVGYVVASFSIEKTGLNLSNTSYSDGAVPAFGIIDSGTAQSATGTTLVLRAASGFANDVVNGATIMAFGSTQGYWQSRQVADYDLATDTVTVDTWTVTPSGTITYILLGTPPAVASGSLPAVNVTQFGGSAGTFASGRPEVNMTHIAGAANSTTTAQLGVNVVQVSTDATAADNLEAMFDGTGYAGGTIKLGVDAVQISGDTTAADNAEAMFDGTGYAGGTIKLGVDAVQISGDATAADNLELFTEGAALGTLPKVNAEEINAATVLGDGTAGNKWRG